MVLDHHRTAVQQLTAAANAPEGLPANLHVLLDMQRSGAALARDYFRPHLSASLEELFRHAHSPSSQQSRQSDDCAAALLLLCCCYCLHRYRTRVVRLVTDPGDRGWLLP